jgi:hypothetical protein
MNCAVQWRRGVGVFAVSTVLTAASYAQQPAQTQPPTGSTPPASTPAGAASSAPQDKASADAIASENPDPLWTFGLFYWKPSFGNPSLRGGAGASDFETLGPLGKPKYAPEAELAIRVTNEDVIRLTVFETNGRSTSVAPASLDLFGTSIASGNFITDQYRVESAKASFEDLLYPFGRSAKLRFKTLWELQAAKIALNTDAPFDTSSGTFPSVSGSRLVVLPAFGGAVQYAASSRLHFEARVSGFGIPHHAETADAEGSLAYRISHAEIVLGGKLYDWKTSPKNAEYFHAMLSGAFMGLRWVGK